MIDMVMRKSKGFTLIELMITVAIIGILSVIAIPSYIDYVLRGKLVEAMTAMSDGRVKMEQYYQDNRVYDCAGLPATALNYFALTCNVPAGGQSFTLTATGKQQASGFAYTIDDANNKATTAVPSGWATQATCWVTKRDGTC